MSIVLWQNQWLLTIYWHNGTFDTIVNIYEHLCMNLLLNKNDPFMWSWMVQVFDLFVSSFKIHQFVTQFGASLIKCRLSTLSLLQRSLLDSKS